MINRARKPQHTPRKYQPSPPNIVHIFNQPSTSKMKVFTLFMMLSTAGLSLAATCKGSRQCECLFPDRSHCCLYGSVCFSMILVGLGTKIGYRTKRPAMTTIAQNCVRALAEFSKATRILQSSAMRAVLSPVPQSSLRRLALLATTTTRYFVPRYTREINF